MQAIENRIRLLVELLCDEKPKGFRSPCVGYVKAIDDLDEPHYGIVFKKSGQGTDAADIKTLHGLLVGQPKPSLTARVSLCLALAECVHSFHSVNWSHKGLRSENIIFVVAKDGNVDLCNPFVTGFELSRPSQIEDMTEKLSHNAGHDIYRHPRAQSTQSGNEYRHPMIFILLQSCSSRLQTGKLLTWSLDLIRVRVSSHQS
jgi:hypothetical protein